MPVERTCATCHVSFVIAPSHTTRGRGRYCSVACRGLAHRIPLEQRFWSKVDRSDLDGCWLWTGDRHEQGYGRIAIRGTRKPVYAHRLAYELEHGPIPPGKEALHSCDNPPCCRHDHIFLGDQKANNQDRDAKGRVRHGERHVSAKLTYAKAQAIRAAYAAGGVSQRGLAALYGVSRGTIDDVLTHATWQRPE